MDNSLKRFEEKYIPEPNTGCWLWMASINGDGYGRLGIGRRSMGAHRFSYEAYIGPITSGLCVLHRCDTPSCVNPAHLFLGTPAVNAADRQKKGRGGRACGELNGSRTHPERVRRGELNGRAKLSEKDVMAIRSETDLSIRRLALKYAVHRTVIRDIKRGDLWRHLL